MKLVWRTENDLYRFFSLENLSSWPRDQLIPTKTTLTPTEYNEILYVWSSAMFGSTSFSLSNHITFNTLTPLPFLPLANEVAERLYVSQACVKNSVHRGCVHPPGQTSPRADTPSWVDTPPAQTFPWADIPLADTSLADGYCSWRYASYWNAFLYKGSSRSSVVSLPLHYMGINL